MIDTDKYEGHTPAPWIIDWSHLNVDKELMQDAPLLLAEVKRLQKLEAAVVGSWMRACDHRGPWHKALRYPCVELGYLTYNAEGLINYELS